MLLQLTSLFSVFCIYLTAKIHAFSPIGIQSVLVEIEVDLHRGLPSFTVVGLGDASVQESRERVRSAIKNSDFLFPVKKIVTSLAPADIRKSGPVFDLPIALGILLETGQIEHSSFVEDSVFVGELSLDGSLRHINGILPISLAAERMGKRHIFVPKNSAKEASLATKVKVYPVKNLRELAHFLSGNTKSIIPAEPSDFRTYCTEQDSITDFSVIRGQEHCKRALEIAAAGAHNILMNGAPGAGKTLLSRAFRGILPGLTREEAIEVAQIYSVSGLLPADKPLPSQRPFRIVHHTGSAVSIVGGGTKIKPGEISLAHRGVLFLDELPEFPSQVLEVLRQPLEDREITISRAQGSIRFPAHFTLVAAMNPCPCGYYNVPNTDRECTCPPSQIAKYQKKISGPLLDRIDLYVDISPVKFEKLSGKKTGETSEEIKQRVSAARKRQELRFKNENRTSNSEMGVNEIERYCSIDDSAKDLLSQAMKQFQLSGRAFHRILKLSRTIADLADSQKIQTPHIAEALQYRPKLSYI
jgi:magnesium chelatase family protein